MLAELAGERLRQAREEKKMSRAKLARELETFPENIYRWEKATSWPKPDVWERLAVILDKDLLWFFGAGELAATGTDGPAPPTGTGAVSLASKRHSRAKAISSTSPISYAQFGPVYATAVGF